MLAESNTSDQRSRIQRSSVRLIRSRRNPNITGRTATRSVVGSIEVEIKFHRWSTTQTESASTSSNSSLHRVLGQYRTGVSLSRTLHIGGELLLQADFLALPKPMILLPLGYPSTSDLPSRHPHRSSRKHRALPILPLIRRLVYLLGSPGSNQLMEHERPPDGEQRLDLWPRHSPLQGTRSVTGRR